MSFQKALDEVERAAIVPVQFVTPVTRFFFEQRLDLTHADLAEIDEIHGRWESPATASRNLRPLSRGQ